MSRGGQPTPFSGPQRTCVGCRSVRLRTSMKRLLVGPDGLCLDRGEGLPGRGAYVCGEAACVPKAVRSLGRALKVKHLEVSVDDLRRILAGDRPEVPVFEARPDDDGPVGGFG